MMVTVYTSKSCKQVIREAFVCKSEGSKTHLRKRFGISYKGKSNACDNGVAAVDRRFVNALAATPRSSLGYRLFWRTLNAM